MLGRGGRETVRKTEREREGPSFANFPLPAAHETSHHTRHYVSLPDFNCEDPAASVDFRHLFIVPPRPLHHSVIFQLRGKERKHGHQLVVMVENGYILVTLSLSALVFSASAPPEVYKLLKMSKRVSWLEKRWRVQNLYVWL